MKFIKFSKFTKFIKKPLRVVPILALCLISLLALGACAKIVNSGVAYADPEKYSAGNAEITDEVNAVDIDWPAGKVVIKYHSLDTVLVTEESNRTLSESVRLHYFLDGTTLRVKYCASGVNRFERGLHKVLTVTLPETLSPELLKVTTVSAPIEGTDIKADKTDIDTVSGDVTLTLAEVPDVEINTVSGRVTVTATGVTETMDINTTSGKIQSTVGEVGTFRADTTSGSVVLNAAKAENVKVDSVSGVVTLDFASAPAKLNVDTTSGKVGLFLPEDTEFTLKHSTVSGKIKYDIPLTHDGNKYVNGNGSAEYFINTVSGTVTLSGKD